jgi:hypothetical protein
MKLLPQNKLGQNGIAHLAALIAIVVVVATGGAFMLVKSHAAAACKNGGFTIQPSGQCVCEDPSKGYITGFDYEYRSCPNKPKATPNKGILSSNEKQSMLQTKAKAKADKAQRIKAKKEIPGGLHGSPAKPQSTDPLPVSIPFAGAPAAATVSGVTAQADPIGNITVVTFADKPIRTRTDQHIGGMQISIERTDGKAQCDTHKNGKGLTNHRESNDSQGNNVHGTIHFVGCNAGTYKVTATGRLGYSLVSHSPKTIHLSGNETQRVSFVFTKK